MKFSVGACFLALRRFGARCASDFAALLRLCHVGNAELGGEALSVAAFGLRFTLVLAVLAGRFAVGARFAMRSRRGDSLDVRRALRFCCGVVCRRHCARTYHSVAALCARCVSAVADLARSLPSLHARPSVSGGAFCLRSCLTSRFCCGDLPSFTPDFAVLLRCFAVVRA